MPGSIACPPPLHCPLTFSHIYSADAHTMRIQAHVHKHWDMLLTYSLMHSNPTRHVRTHDDSCTADACVHMTAAEPPVSPWLLKPPSSSPGLSPSTQASGRRQHHTLLHTILWWQVFYTINFQRWQTTTTCAWLWNWTAIANIDSRVMSVCLCLWMRVYQSQQDTVNTHRWSEHFLEGEFVKL